MNPSRRSRRAALAAVLAGVLVVAGCSGGPILRPRVVPPSDVATAPSADTPLGALRRLGWSYNQRDTLVHRDLYSADYRFLFAPADSAGSRFPGHQLSRDDELRFARAAFVLGNAEEPPPLSILFLVDNNLVALPDSRRGKNGRIHKEIAANILLRIEQPDLDVLGVIHVYVVRGDSAAWPPDVARTGPDSTRWFIEQWNDETYDNPRGGEPHRQIPAPASGRASRLRTLPTRSISFGRVKSLWLE